MGDDYYFFDDDIKKYGVKQRQQELPWSLTLSSQKWHLFALHILHVCLILTTNKQTETKQPCKMSTKRVCRIYSRIRESLKCEKMKKGKHFVSIKK